MDLQSPAVVALIASILTALLHWAFVKWIIKDAEAEKVLGKGLASAAVAATLTILYVKQFEAVPSLQADAFFAPAM